MTEQDLIEIRKIMREEIINLVPPVIRFETTALKKVLSSKIDGKIEEVNYKINNLEDRTKETILKILERQDERFNNIENKLDLHEKRFDSIEDKLDKVLRMLFNQTEMVLEHQVLISDHTKRIRNLESSQLTTSNI